MFIFNFKLKKNFLSKIIICFFSLLIFLLLIFVGLKIFSSNNSNLFINDSIPGSEYATILPENYTNILKAVHNNTENYINQKIIFSGYVYKVSNLKNNEFILARDMDIGNNQSVVVGFICSYENTNELQEYEWIEIKGEITKGEYNGNTMPIIKILSLNKINKPDNATVPMPDDTYVPTCTIY